MACRIVTAREQHEMLSPWLGMRRITPRSSGADLGDPTPRGSVYYHNTDSEFEPGDELIPAQESGHDSRWKNAPGYLPSMVYVYDEHGDPDEYSSLGRHRYEVEPIGDIYRDPEQHHNRAFQDLGVHDPNKPTGNAHSYVVPRARVVRRIGMLSPWRRAAAPRRKMNRKPTRHDIPIDVLKQYSTFNPYDPEDGEPPEQIAEYMGDYENTLRDEGWDGFGKWGQPPNYPHLSVGRSGLHAVLNGHHRLWAADRLGLTHVPVEITQEDDDDWAKTYGRPVENHVSGLLGGSR